MPTIIRREFAVMTAAAIVTIGRRARAQGLGQPTGKPILTVSGAITVHNRDDTAVFDRPMLEALGFSSFRTRTPWYNGPELFQGVLMEKLMQTVGARGDSVIASALNDYSTTIPISDFTRYGVLLAMKRDGKDMPISDKGPLFIVYPYDNSPALQNQTYYSRSAWQVAAIKVV